MQTRKPIKPLPVSVYFWTVAALTLVGLLDSIYLALAHYRVYTDIGYQSFCAFSKSINCDTVSQSPYSVFLNVPVPVWGIIGYSFFLLLLPLVWSDRVEKKRGWTVLFMLSLWFSLCSIILAYISAYYIHSYCIMCILSFAVTFMLLFYTWLTRKRFNIRGLVGGFKDDISFISKRKALSLLLLGPFLIAVILVMTFFPVYWSFEAAVLTAHIPHGLTQEGHPWIGARNPKLEIIEFTDYQCFQCNKMHYFLRQTMVKHPGKIRVIHRHFPMDHEVNPIVKAPLHPGSGKLAMLTIYAANKNKFWQLSDLLFSIARVTPNIRLKVLADAVGLDYHQLSKSLSDRKIRNQLQKDIVDGLKLGINGTPSFVINGKVFQGQIPPEIIRQALE